MSDSKGAAIQKVVAKYITRETHKGSVNRVRHLMTEAILAILAQEVKRIIGEGEKVIKVWENHAYSLDSQVNDTLIYQKHTNADKNRRNNDVTDRRAILLAHEMLAEMRRKAGLV